MTIVLYVWSLTLLGLGAYYCIAVGASWTWLVLGVGAVTAVIVWRAKGLRSRLYAVLWLHVLALGVAAPLTSADVYVVGFILGAALLLVGNALHQELSRVRRRLEESRGRAPGSDESAG